MPGKIANKPAPSLDQGSLEIGLAPMEAQEMLIGK